MRAVGRCARYNRKEHPRIRLREAEIEKQILALFDRIRIQDEKVRGWFRRSLQAYTRQGQQDHEQQLDELTRRLTLLRNQQDRLLNLRLLEEVDDASYANKNVELRDQIAETKLEIEQLDRGRAEQAEIAMKVFELFSRGRNSCPHHQKALRRTRRRARF